MKAHTLPSMSGAQKKPLAEPVEIPVPPGLAHVLGKRPPHALNMDYQMVEAMFRRTKPLDAL